MASVNQVYLLGRLTRDPELRRTKSGIAFCDLSMAINEKGKGGEDRTTFVDVQAWDRQAETSAEHLRKGSTIFVECRLAVDQWDDKATGQKRSKLKVVAGRVQFLDGRQSDQKTQEPEAEWK